MVNSVVIAFTAPEPATLGPGVRQRTNMGLALVLAYIAISLLSPADMFPVLAPYRLNLMLGLASLPLALVARLRAPEIAKLRTQMILVILFVAFASCSWLPHGWVSGNLETVLELAPNVIVYFVGVVLFRSPLRLGLLRATLVMVSLFVIAAAFSQIPYARATGETTPYVMAGLGPDNTPELRIRGLGMLNDPNIFGQYLLLILPLLFVGKREGGLGFGYLIAIPLALLLVMAVFFTNSRSAETGLAVLIGLFLIKRFKTIGAVVSVVVATLLLLGINATRTRTITLSEGLDRMAIWSEGMQYFKHSPIWGIGVRGFMEREVMTAHNSYLLCAAEVGMVGFFLWMGMLVVTIIQLNRVPKIVGKSNPALARWAAAVQLSLGGYLFTSFFLSCTYNLPLFLLLGMAGAIIGLAGGDETMPLRGTRWPVWSFGLCGGALTLIYVMLRLRVVPG